MSRAVQPEPVASTTAPDAGADEAYTARRATPAPGDEVTAGQMLATVDSPQLRANVAAAQSSVAKADAQLADDQSSGSSAQRLAVDEESVAAANDQLTSAQTALNGASLIATFDGL